jgi:hypothetical protein
MWSGRWKRPQPRYSFFRFWKKWRVIDDETNMVMGEYFEREDARRKMYELNGWKYKSKNGGE